MVAVRQAQGLVVAPGERVPVLGRGGRWVAFRECGAQSVKALGDRCGPAPGAVDAQVVIGYVAEKGGMMRRLLILAVLILGTLFKTPGK